MKKIKDETLKITKENIVNILDKIQEFIEDSEIEDWNKREIREISNRVVGLKESIKEIKNKIK